MAHSLVGAVVDLIDRGRPAPGRSPVVLQRRALARMVETVSPGIGGRPLVPSAFRVVVGPDDHERLEPMRRWFCRGLASAFADRVAARGWPSAGPPVVVLALDRWRPEGAPGVVASFASDEGRGAVLRGLGGDRPVRDLTRIGRDRRAEVAVADPTVSRRHCHLELVGDHWFVCDSGSLNGTYVNGRRVSGRLPLGDGDQLTVGTTVFTFRPVGVLSPAPGT